MTLSAPRRQRLVEIARERELLVLEDNPYGLLRYEGEPLPTLYSLDGGDYVLYLGTFSKILSPGIRLGWVAAPGPVLAKIKLGKQAADLCTSSLTQQLVDAYFAEGRWRNYIQDLCTIYRQRRDAMLDALAEFFPPEAEWTQPGGGLFIWATLPDFIDTERPARQGDPRGERRVRARLGGLRGRSRRQLDAAQLLGRRRRRHRRGRAPDRQGRRRADRAVRDLHRRAQPVRRRAAGRR